MTPAPITVSRPVALHSAIYEGIVTHRRFDPVDHAFSYRVAMPYLDLAELPSMFGLHPLWSVEHPNLVSFRRRDYLGEEPTPLDTSVRDLVEQRSGRRPEGPIRMLTHVRTWGWLFNPITFYFCFDPRGLTVETTVVEVTNTPWHERIAYLIPGETSPDSGMAAEETEPGPGTRAEETGPGPGMAPNEGCRVGDGSRFAEQLIDKQLHVSPFFPMDLVHRFRIGIPGEGLSVSVDNLRGGERIFNASMTLHRLPASRQTLGHMLWAYPAMTLRVSAGIYRQALVLRRKGAPFHHHPGESSEPRKGET